MKAVVYTRYGTPDVLDIKEVETPTPKDNEILIKIYATTVNRTDYATINAIPFFARIVTGLFRPKRKIPGTEFAGIVEQLGKGVTNKKIGDKVFGFFDMSPGAQAQYMAIDEKLTVEIPENIAFQQAAASCEGAHYAYCSFKRINLKKGQNTLIYGASGAIGSAALQLLKHFGMKVTAVVSTRHIDLMASLGADKIVDYTRKDFTKDDQQYDFVFDSVGKSSFRKCFKLLKPGGVYLSSDLGFLGQNIFLPLITPVIKPILGNRKTIFPIPDDIRGSLLLIKDLIEKGKFKSVIDREYPLEKIVEAYKYVGEKHKTGSVVITVNHEK